MNIILANPRGFCAGVYMAIGVVDQILAIVPDRPIYVYHEIVHNRHVVRRFVQRGVVFVDDLSDLPEGSILIYSAHGVSPEIRQLAKDRNLRAIDATCPLVTKVHMEAIRYANEGYEIILIGHNGHDEVIGTIGEAPHAIHIIETTKDIDRLTIKNPERLAYLMQTTLSLHDAKQITQALKSKYPEIKSPPGEDICYATTNRQTVVQKLAPQCDLVLVVGSENSSNSKRLAEIADASGTPAHLIDEASEMCDEWFTPETNQLLLTSGASAPEDLVREILDVLITKHNATVQQANLIDEHMSFGLPADLKNLMRSLNIDPNDREIGALPGNHIDDWLQSRNAAANPIHLTISGKTKPSNESNQS